MISLSDEKKPAPLEEANESLPNPEDEDIIIHPQRTSDPLDPLNWSWMRKHSILGIVMLKYFLFTYITTTTVPSFPAIQSQFNVSYDQVNWTVAIPALGLSVGPLLWSSLADIYGRRIIFIVGTIISLVSSIGAAVAHNYAGYMSARFFQGLGVSPGSTVGMAVVNDLFFDYERGQKLGLWVLALDSGLLLGPTFGGFLNLLSAAWINWFTVILFGVLLVLEILFMTETLYPRSLLLTQSLPPPHSHPDINPEPPLSLEPKTNPPSSSSSSPSPITNTTPSIRRTQTLPLLNIHPIPGLHHPSPLSSIHRFLLTFRLPVIILAVTGYSFTWYWWILSIITMMPAAYASYTPLIQGLLFLGLLLGTVLSEILVSGRLSDALMRRLTRRNAGVRVPEMRLWMVYPAMVATGVGLVVWGVSVQRGWHWGVGQVGLFLVASGIQVGNTITSAYIVDCYPLQSSSVVVFYAVVLNLSAFVNPFLISPWQASAGWTWTFTAQALIVVGAGTGVFGCLHYFGGWMRAKTKMPGWRNAEFDS
ncbi:putative MFS transporter [Aspergillus steynii IBT 23096]|uniref:Putative MFS transporter n=1 Tax=Aspergillus steynii IBT 23096 TaxID=1392250 RepID=A0A2I2FUJ5_9EURO|nr:putative MFS transporter [Aspergillus steynii IBT 23096]PLB44313.1 putative MFS transporter [Aspergillus steynii IBT 23096]